MPTPSIHAFAEKVAVITDGANPVGRAIALQLALQGSYVIVGMSEAADADRSALDELTSIGTLASVVEADVAKPEGVSTLIGAAASAFGRIDLLVNVFPSAPDAAGLVLEAAMPLMSSRPKPKVVNVCGYSKADGEIEKIMNGMAELVEMSVAQLPAKFRINCVSVGEGFGGAREGLDPELFPAREGVDADDAARVAVFLLSSESAGINGRNIVVGR